MSPELEPKSAVWKRAIAPVLVAALSMVAFIPAFSADYSDFDDIGTLFLTLNYREITPESLHWMFTTGKLGHYQPLAWLSFAIEYAIVGDMKPAVSHSINIAIHALSTAMVCVLARKLISLAKPSLPELATEAAAMLSALLFAVHPLRVESVAWVTERRDVLSLFFYLLALLSYLRAYPPGSVRPTSTGAAALVFVWFVLSLFAKAWGMTFFVVLLILDWYPLRRMPWPGLAWLKPEARAALIQKLPFAVVGIAWVFIAGVAQSSNRGVTASLSQWTILDRLCQSCYGVMFYLWKSMTPVNLAALYELPPSMKPSEPRVIAGFAVVAAIVILVLLLRRRLPGLVAALLAYVVIVSPVLGLFQSGIQLVADRYSYLSTIGLAIAAGAGIVMLASRTRNVGRVAISGACITIVAALTALSWRQSELWRSTEQLFAHAIKAGQDGPILRVNYGRELAGTPRFDHSAAIVQFKRAIELKPDYGEARFCLAGSLHALNHVDDALREFVEAGKTMPDSWRADIQVGLLLAEKKDDLEGALRLFQLAVKKVEGPESWSFAPGPYMLLAQAQYDSGDTRGATESLRKAARFKETHDKAMNALRMIEGSRR